MEVPVVPDTFRGIMRRFAAGSSLKKPRRASQRGSSVLGSFVTLSMTEA